jgi:putative acetyltransferase
MSASEDIRLRPATNADGPAIQSLVFAVLGEHGLSPDPAGTDADLRDIESYYQRRGGAFDVLERTDGSVLGCVGLAPIDSDTCELRKMYLIPSARRRGLGRRLLDSALCKAEALGFRRIVLETASVLTEAVALYKRYGFKPYSPEHLSKRCNEAYLLDLPSSRRSC